jgi:hypothetical protein
MDTPVPSGLSAGCMLATYRAMRPVGTRVSLLIPGNLTNGQLSFTGLVCGYSSDARFAVAVPTGTLSGQPRSASGSTLTVECNGRMRPTRRLTSAGSGAIEDARRLPSFPIRRLCPVWPSPIGRRRGSVASKTRDIPACQRSSSRHGIARADVVDVGVRACLGALRCGADPVGGCRMARGQWREDPSIRGRPGMGGIDSVDGQRELRSPTAAWTPLSAVTARYVARRATAPSHGSAVARPGEKRAAATRRVRLSNSVPSGGKD